jgi:hypothetical protein
VKTALQSEIEAFFGLQSVPPLFVGFFSHKKSAACESDAVNGDIQF